MEFYRVQSKLAMIWRLEQFIWNMIKLYELIRYGPRREQTCLWGFRQSVIQTSLLSTETSKKIEISLIASLDMLLCSKQVTKALTRLRGCAGWCVHLLFAHPRRQVFSRQGPYYKREINGLKFTGLPCSRLIEFNVLNTILLPDKKRHK